MGAIKLQAVEKWYGEVQVIKGVDLDIEDGEFVIFVGPSGCGKAMPASANTCATRASSISALKPTKTAARPTSECIAATSSGIWVICTRVASW